MAIYEGLEIWFVTGSQHLYGPKTLAQVAEDSQAIVNKLNEAGLPITLVWKPTVKTSTEIYDVCLAANNTPNCVGLITWMHTFSPAKMWIGGLKILSKPMLHLHTQFNRDIPWSEIDMDYMNLHQSAHGDREFGHIVSRMRRNVKVVAGHWSEADVQHRISVWMRVAAAWADSQDMKIARFGDNMRNVAVTDGDKVEAELRFGYHVDYYPIGDLVAYIEKVTDAEIAAIVSQYDADYDVAPNAQEGGADRQSVVESARIEAALRKFLTERNIKAFTTNFEALRDVHQLPGLASQRLMNEGYGFGAEGDWKTAALLRHMKVMSKGLKGGTSFMEDYTYHLDPANKAILQSHMLEICPSIAAQKPSLQVHKLGIGGKADPARILFNAPAGDGIAATVVDMGNRFRMIVNVVDVIDPIATLPKLPVAFALWKPQPDFQTSTEGWILSGGTHHTSFSMAITKEYLEDFAAMADIELVVIENGSTISELKKELRYNDVYYMLNKANQY